MTCYEFIKKNIDKTTKSGITNEEETFIPLPYPYSTPCVDGMFQEMFYWDTYFTNKALFALGRKQQAVYNIRNIAFLLERYGKIPNGNRTYYSNRSQVPFFGCMLEDALVYATNLLTVEEAYEWLKKEYAFWQEKRSAPIGLNRYGCDGNEMGMGDILTLYQNRTGIALTKTEENYFSVFGECESGWDFSPRFSSACAEYCPIDLNCLLYKDELLLSKWAKELGKEQQSTTYTQKAEERKNKIRKYCQKDGLFYDYNFRKNECSPVLSCASFFPYWLGVASDIDGFQRTVKRLEGAYGVYACDFSAGEYQWSKPNSWAPLNWVAVQAAQAVGCDVAAKRLADKYSRAIEKIFAETGNLWEKYNAENGSLEVLSEYGTPAMLGWTAGVYVDVKKKYN